MFLFKDLNESSSLKVIQELFSENILYVLWDLKIKVGHSFRDIPTVISEAKGNLATSNSMLETRLIAGSTNLFDKCMAEFDSYYNGLDVRNLILQQIEEETTRISSRIQFFLQAPEIKNGPGGLRDYQSILWMARAKFGSYRMEELVKHDIISPADHKVLVTAYKLSS